MTALKKYQWATLVPNNNGGIWQPIPEPDACFYAASHTQARAIARRQLMDASGEGINAENEKRFLDMQFSHDPLGGAPPCPNAITYFEWPDHLEAVVWVREDT